MSDDWNDDGEPVRKKGGVPRWLVWTCGIGCAVMLLLGVAAGAGGYVLYQRATDPEVVIPKVQEYLPCEEWPEDYEAWGVSMFGGGQFMIRWPEGTWQLQVVSTREELDMFMGTEGPAHMMEEDIELTEIEVQGRTTRAQTYKAKFGDVRMARVDISGDVRPFAMLTFNVGSGGGIDAEKVRGFLEPFDVWRGED